MKIQEKKETTVAAAVTLKTEDEGAEPTTCSC